MLLALSGVVISMVLIWRACDGFEAATGYLGRKMTDGVRGATFNAIGSSLPELLATSVALLFYANKEGFAFGIGTTAGSAVFNSAIIPALVILTVTMAAITTGVVVSKKVILRDGIALILCELLLVGILMSPELNWLHGLSLVGAYVTYIMYTLIKSPQNDVETYEDEPSDERSLSAFLSFDVRRAVIGSNEFDTPSAWLVLAVATFIIGGACHILVESCYRIGDLMEINTYFIAVILAAAATSVPDTIISIKDAKSGEYDDAVANALGSNIFDICVCLGLPLLIYCVVTGETISVGASNSGNVSELRVLLLFLTIAVFFLMLFSKKLTKSSGFVLIGIYVFFVSFIVGRANNMEFAEKLGSFFQKLLGA